MRLTVSEAAARFGYKSRAVRTWIARGLLTPYRVGNRGHYRVDSDELDRLTRRFAAQQLAHVEAAKNFSENFRQVVAASKIDIAASRRKYREQWAKEQRGTVH